MRRRLFVPTIVAWLTLAVGLAAGAKQNNTPRAPRVDDWTAFRTSHFSIYSNASSARTRKIALSLERFRAALARITRGLQLDAHVPTRIYAFKNDPTFRPYKRDAAGKPLHVSGYFLPGPFANIITLDASAGYRPMRVVFHEYFHAVMDASLGNLPLWLNEGLAEYFSTFRDSDGSTKIEVGHPIEAHLFVLQGGKTIPWDDVFATTTDSPSYNESARQGGFYAQSWLLVHYLVSDETRAKQLGRYLTLLRDSTPEEEAFTVAFEADRATVAAAASEHLESGGGHLRWDLGETAQDISFETRELESAETLFLLGDLLARRAQIAAAANHLEPARAAGWPAGPIETAYGYAAFYDNDDVAAEDHFRRAIAAGDVTAEPYVLLADLLMERYRQVGASATPQAETAPALLDVRRLLEAAPQPAGGEYHVLTGLASSYLLGAGDVSKGVAAVEQALRLRPQTAETVRLGACLLARQGRPAEAWAVVARELAPHDPAVARETGFCIADALVTAAWERQQSGDVEGAVAILTAAIAATPDPTSAARFAALQRIMTGSAKIVFAEPEHDDRIEQYNHAAQLAEAGRYAEAVQALEALLEDCGTESICAEAAESVERLRAVVEHNGWVTQFNAAVDLANNRDRRGAIAQLRQLESEVTDADLLASVIALLQRLGARSAK